MPEEWKPIPGFETKYSISTLGRIRNTRKGNLLAGSLNPQGYRQVSLTLDSGGIVVRRIHKLMLEAFVGPCPPRMHALHWDDVKINNVLSNLRWGTQTDNMNDMVRNGRHGGVKKTSCPKEHPYDESNTYLYQGRRYCRKCKIIEQRNRLNQTPRTAKI